MKNASACLLLLPVLLAAAAPAAPADAPDTRLPAWDRLQTLDGKVYQQARILRVDLDEALLQQLGGVLQMPAAAFAPAETARRHLHDLPGQSPRRIPRVDAPPGDGPLAVERLFR